MHSAPALALATLGYYVEECVVTWASRSTGRRIPHWMRAHTFLKQTQPRQTRLSSFQVISSRDRPTLLASSCALPNHLFFLQRKTPTSEIIIILFKLGQVAKLANLQAPRSFRVVHLHSQFKARQFQFHLYLLIDLFALY